VRRAGRAQLPGTGPRLGHVAARFTRWMQVLMAHRPALFPFVPLLFASTPVLLGCAALSAQPLAWALAAALVVQRAALAAWLDGESAPAALWLGAPTLLLLGLSAIARPRRLRFAWLAAEAVLLWCWLRALLSRRRVQWRGRRLVVGAHGVLVGSDA